MNENLVAKLEEKRDRRGLLALIGGGGIAAVAALVAGGSKDAEAAHNGTNVLHVGETNTAPAGAVTRLIASVEDDVEGAFVVEANPEANKAIQGFGGVGGFSESKPGGEFRSGTAFGCFGQAERTVGVFGGSFTGAGVVGHSGFLERGPVDPEPAGPGVLGISPLDGPGVRAVSGTWEGETADVLTPVLDGGLALDVVGMARFSTAGNATIPQGQNSVFVANAAVTADSHISVTLAGNPGSRQLHYLSRSPGAGFTLNLTSAAPPHRPATPFTYLIVEPGS